MRAFRDVLRFELALHLRSPLFWGVALMFFLLHLLTLTRTGINLSDNEQIALNSAWMIFQTELVLGAVGMLPAIVFAVTAMTRDAERSMTELFFTTPVSRAAFLLGRAGGGMLAACAVGVVGVLGALAGSFMPGLDPTRLTAFDWWPWAASLGFLVLPNLLVSSTLFFSVAALTRSTALTLGAALGVLVLEVFINVRTVPPVPSWLLLLDPLGGLPIAESGRLWTVAELNGRLPTTLLLPNRVVWLGVALGALLLTLKGSRLELAGTRGRRFTRIRLGSPSVPTSHVLSPPTPRFDREATMRQLASQLRMDWRGVWHSPMFWLALGFTAFAMWSEATNLRSPLAGLPLYPATGLLLDFVGPSLSQFLLLAIIYYSAVLVFRERDADLAGMCGAAPYPDWIPAVSKAVALCGVVSAVLIVTMGVLLVAQEAADFHDHAVGVMAQGVFVYTGVFAWMLAVVAVLVQIASPGKWSGMVLVLLVFVVALALPALGFDHMLYGFRLPAVVYSDMNGFGQDRLPTYAMVAYRGALCVLVLVAGHLLFPRGDDATWRERLDDARTRLSTSVLRTVTVASLVFVAVGGFIFYNTNVLNQYETWEEERAARGRYERDYGRYRDAPSPSIVDPDIAVEVFAAERRLTSRGTAGLRNAKSHPMTEFVVSVDRRNRVDELVVDGAALATSDPAQGFYVFRPSSPLAPGAMLTMRWRIERENRGFPNTNADRELVANGSYLRSSHLPTLGYCGECELTSDRRRYGLPEASRLPTLGDPAHLDDLRAGTDLRTSFRIVIGTDDDQTAVAPGQLRRTWRENGRNYFEYGLAGPVWPLVTVQSARYTTARDRWNDVALEVYHDARHSWNVRAMLETAKKGLALYSREFSPYALPYYRIAEYARYRSNVQAGVGTIAYSEGSGFMTDLRGWANLDYATLHELAHQWWGNVYGARMQGRQLLNEGLAQYSTVMAYREFAEPVFARRLMAGFHQAYLDARGNEALDERPVALTEDQGYISYDKAPLALLALEALIGRDHLNGALRSYYTRFVNAGPPFPTSRDLIDELRTAAGPEHQALITDLFEKITLYDVGITAVDLRAGDGGYDVTLDVRARQVEAAGNGDEHDVPLDAWFQIAVFPPSDRDVMELEPLYVKHHRLHTGTQRITVHVTKRPGSVGVDPFYLMIDRKRDDNVRPMPPSLAPA